MKEYSRSTNSIGLITILNGSMSIARAGQFEIKRTIINTISEAPWTQGALYLYDGLTEKSSIIVKTVLR